MDLAAGVIVIGVIAAIALILSAVSLVYVQQELHKIRPILDDIDRQVHAIRSVSDKINSTVDGIHIPSF